MTTEIDPTVTKATLTIVVGGDTTSWTATSEGSLNWPDRWLEAAELVRKVANSAHRWLAAAPGLDMWEHELVEQRRVDPDKEE